MIGMIYGLLLFYTNKKTIQFNGFVYYLLKCIIKTEYLLCSGVTKKENDFFKTPVF